MTALILPEKWASFSVSSSLIKDLLRDMYYRLLNCLKGILYVLYVSIIC